jgi:hypothetical protein
VTPARTPLSIAAAEGTRSTSDALPYAGVTTGSLRAPDATGSGHRVTVAAESDWANDSSWLTASGPSAAALIRSEKSSAVIVPV